MALPPYISCNRFLPAGVYQSLPAMGEKNNREFLHFGEEGQDRILSVPAY